MPQTTKASRVFSSSSSDALFPGWSTVATYKNVPPYHGVQKEGPLNMGDTYGDKHGDSSPWAFVVNMDER